MTEPFPVVSVDRRLAKNLEQLGTKRKFWFQRDVNDETEWLFKAEERQTGEDLPDGILNSLDVFAGYLMLDALIANQDRHQMNPSRKESVGSMAPILITMLPISPERLVLRSTAMSPIPDHWVHQKRSGDFHRCAWAAAKVG